MGESSVAWWSKQPIEGDWHDPEFRAQVNQAARRKKAAPPFNRIADIASGVANPEEGDPEVTDDDDTTL
jgi:hypothetical protein